MDWSMRDVELGLPCSSDTAAWGHLGCIAQKSQAIEYYCRMQPFLDFKYDEIRNGQRRSPSEMKMVGVLPDSLPWWES